MNPITVEEHQWLIENIKQQNMTGQETLGTSIRRLRIEVTGLDRATLRDLADLADLRHEDDAWCDSEHPEHPGGTTRAQQEARYTTFCT